MSYYRVQIDIAVKQPIPKALKNKLPQIRDAIKLLKSYAENVGDEMTVRAVYHECRHDEGLPCEPEQEI